MKKIVIIPNNNKEAAFEIAERIAAIISKNGAIAYVDEKYGADYNKIAASYSEFPNDAELIIVVGGDGSVIDASLLAVKYDIPVLGVNLGNFGYLAEVEPSELDSINKLFCGEYKIEEKMLLCIKGAQGSEAEYGRFAVNDIIISHESYLGISEFTLVTDNNESVKYRSDGMILSTPAGSTAYSLSAGGPIVDHGINAILATPICPHSFFNRSIIFNENTKITIKNTGKSTLKISIDGRLVKNLDVGGECVIMQANKKLKMLAFSSNNMLATLFAKMQKIENI